MNARIKVITAMAIYGSLGLFVTALTIPSNQIVMVRAVVGFAFLFVISLFVKDDTKKEDYRRALPLMLIVGGIMGTNWLLLFSAYNYTLVSIATLCYYLAPIVVISLCAVFLKERLTAAKLVGIAVVIVGMVLINGFYVGGENPLKGVVFSLVAAVMYGTVVFLNKSSKMFKTIGGLKLTMTEILGAAIVMTAYTAITYNGEMAGLDSKSIVILIVLGVVHTGIAFWLYFSAIPQLSGQTLAVLSYVDPLTALLFSAVFLSERLTALQWVGALLILGGAIFTELYRPRASSSQNASAER